MMSTEKYITVIYYDNVLNTKAYFYRTLIDLTLRVVSGNKFNLVGTSKYT